VFEGIQDLKASPSPKKVPSLNVSCLTRTLYFYSLLSAMVLLQSLSITSLCFLQRQSSFSQRARLQQLSNKRIL
jgi:hypothetical protein